MTEVVRKGIQEAQLQLQKANEERLLEEVRPHSALCSPEVTPLPGAPSPLLDCALQGLLRQIPVVGSVLNWFSPFQASPKGRTFNLTAGRAGGTCTVPGCHWHCPGLCWACSTSSVLVWSWVTQSTLCVCRNVLCTISVTPTKNLLLYSNIAVSILVNWFFLTCRLSRIHRIYVCIKGPGNRQHPTTNSHFQPCKAKTSW